MWRHDGDNWSSSVNIYIYIYIFETAVDTCPERMDAADAEAPRPPRIEMAMEFCPRMAVESMETEVEVCPRVVVESIEVETAVDFFSGEDARGSGYLSGFLVLSFVLARFLLSCFDLHILTCFLSAKILMLSVCADTQNKTIFS